MILACSSSQRRRSSSSRVNRSVRASWYVAKPPPWVQVVLPPAPSSTVTTRVAVRASSSRSWQTNSTVFGDSRSASSSHRLPGHVEVVVRLVEQQHLVRPAEQGLEHQPLLLAAGERAHLAPLRLVERDAERRDRAGVPEHLGVVPAGVGPVGQRLRVAHLGRLVVVLHHRQLGLLEGGGRRPHRRRRDRHQQVAHRRVVAHRADELPHHAEAAGRGRASPRAGRCRRRRFAAGWSCPSRWRRPGRPSRRHPPGTTRRRAGSARPAGSS